MTEAAFIAWVALSLTGGLVVGLFFLAEEMPLICSRFREWREARRWLAQELSHIDQRTKRHATLAANMRELSRYIERQKREQRRCYTR